MNLWKYLAFLSRSNLSPTLSEPLNPPPPGATSVIPPPSSSSSLPPPPPSRHRHHRRRQRTFLSSTRIEYEEDRTVFIHHPEAPANWTDEFIDNTVRTARYTWYNFVPLFLFQQFRRGANFYFLIICILQIIPSISITNSVPTTAIPLAAVLLFDGIVTAREDYVRHRDDTLSNNRVAYVSRNRNEPFRPVPWKDIRVGDIVRIRRGEEFPADLVFLAASHDDPEQRGFCHVQTAQLDGETNLKLRQSPESIYPYVNNDKDAQNFTGKIICEAPNEFFGKFTGVYYPYVPATGNADGRDGGGVPIDSQSTLLRGCILRNVDQIYGVVVYTGNETKVRVKQKSILGKKAAIETQINHNILALFLLQCVLCIAGAIGYILWNNDTTNLRMWYLMLTTASFGDAVTRGLTFFLYTSNLIPISLYVTMKLVRTAQTFFMNADEDCVYIDEEQFSKSQGLSGKYPLRVRSLDLNDELGQITHIFSDKTGTLTSNYMELRKLSIHGIAYGLGTTEIGIARRRRLGIEITPTLEEYEYLRGSGNIEKIDKENRNPSIDNTKGSSVSSPTYVSNSSAPSSPSVPMRPILREIPHVNYLDGSDDPPDHYLRGPFSDINGTGARNTPAQAIACHYFFLNLALNHTVVLERIHDSVSGEYTGATQLSASSPDEEAFVLAAEYFGYKFYSRVKDTVTLMIYGTAYTYRIVTILPYTQARKMMSILVEDLQYGNGDTDNGNGTNEGSKGSRYYLFTKGADSKVLQTLTPSHYTETNIEQRTPDRGNIHQRSNVTESKVDRTLSPLPAEMDETGSTTPSTSTNGEEKSVRITTSPSLPSSSPTEPDSSFPGTAPASHVYVKTKEHTREWAQDGLRTLIFAYKPVPSMIVDTWLTNFRNAITDMDEKRKQDNHEPNRIDTLQQEMEQNLLLQGATANEDKLQEGVPETISMLAEAGVKVAMLTGDRQETAVNIGFATRLLTTEYEQFIVTVDELDDPDDAVDLVRSKADELAPLVLANPVSLSSSRSSAFRRTPSFFLPQRLRKRKSEYLPPIAEPAIPFALIVDEVVMDILLRGHENRRNFLIVFSAARAVICCRCRPDQKRQMVDLVRTGIRDARTLAIGDGANDVDMILTANVGVGISGAEGVQAANAADYSIGQFRFLQKLLFVHGRWNYNRISLVVLYMFWKNVLFAFAQLPFIPIAAWDGQRLFIEVGSQTYNLVYTGLPILIAGTLDQDITAKNALRFPYLYSDGIAHRRLNLYRLILTMIDAMIEGILIFLFCWLATTETSYKGSVPYIFELGTYVFTAVIVVVSIRLAMMVHRHYRLFIISIAFCSLVWVGVAWIIDAINADRCQGCMKLIFGQPMFWFLMLFIPVLVLFPVMLYLILHRWNFPEYRDLVVETEAILPRENEPATWYQSCLTCGMRRSVQPYRTFVPPILTNLEKEDNVLQESTMVITPVLPPVDIHRSVYRRPGKIQEQFVPFPTIERRTLPLREDVELALRDWPAQQRLFVSLSRMQKLGYSDKDVLLRWYTLLEQRLQYLMEKEGNHAQVLPYMYRVHCTPPMVEGLVPAPIKLEEILEHPPTEERIPSPPALPVPSRAPKRRKRPVTIGVPAELVPPSAQGRQRIPVVMPTRITRPPRTGSDFSVDLTHMDVYSNLLSSVGRRATNVPSPRVRSYTSTIGTTAEATAALSRQPTLPLPMVTTTSMYATVPLVETVPRPRHLRVQSDITGQTSLRARPDKKNDV